jgi:hypothetical protein
LRKDSRLGVKDNIGLEEGPPTSQIWNKSLLIWKVGAKQPPHFMTTNKTNGTIPDSNAQRTALENIENEVAQLTRLLAQEPTSEGETEIAELLQRLESADGMATGVESKLDSLLGNLDDMLASLEPSSKESAVTVMQESAEQEVLIKPTNGELDR